LSRPKVKVSSAMTYPESTGGFTRVVAFSHATSLPGLRSSSFLSASLPSLFIHHHHPQPPSTIVMTNHPPSTAISNDRISRDEDKAMDKQVPSNGHVEPGISIRMGPVVDAMDVDAPATNGANGKRKARASLTNGKTYKDASSSEEDDKPLVRFLI
jgi:hypothetical protein